MECSNYRVQGTSESELSSYVCTGHESYCTSYLCDDVGRKRVEFCRNLDNITRNPGGDGGTCMERNGGAEYAKEYCKVGDRMVSAGVCNRDNLQNYYDSLAEAYCKTENGKANPWCSCYNVTNGVCNTNTTAAGCAQKRQTYDKLVEATPEDYKESWSDMEPCFGGVCVGNKYLPGGYNTNCSRPVQICDMNFEFQTIADSTINATCNQTANVGSPTGGGTETGGIGDYIPKSLDELKADSKKQIGVTGIVSILSVLCIAIILITVGISGNNKSVRTRFK